MTRSAATPIATAGAVAAAVVLLALDDGGYGLASRSSAGLVLWWGLALALALRLVPRARVPWAAWGALAALAALAAWALASAAWAPAAEWPVIESERVALLLGVALLAVLAVPGAGAGPWLGGAAAGVAVSSALALASRLFPGLGLADDVDAYTVRLTYPLGYWNGTAILAALGVPLALTVAASRAPLALRSAAVALLPLSASVVYLASSRGAAATGVAGGVAALLLLPRRWPALGAAWLGGCAAAVTVAVLNSRDALLDGPLGTDVAASEGRWAALWIALAAAAACVLFAIGTRMLRDLEPPRAVGWATAAALGAAGVALVVALHPIRRFEHFKAMPQPLGDDDFIRSHFTSSTGSGRWQLWESAVDQWRAEPLHGTGAGTYEQWWAVNGSIPSFVRDAHNLYVETLGELGVVGLALLAAVLAVPLVTGSVRALARRDTSAAGATAVVAAFAVAASVDWVWELTAISGIAALAIGLATGPGTLRDEAERRRPRLVLALPAAAAALAVALSQGATFLSELRLEESRDAAARGDAAAALDAALDAGELQPWAASPPLQAALAAELGGDLALAASYAREAIDRDPENWRPWLTLARIEVTLGRPEAAKRSLARAVALNPRSPLFQGLALDG